MFTSDLNLMLLFVAIAVLAILTILCFVLCMICFSRVHGIKKRTDNILTEDVLLEYIDKMRGSATSGGSADPNAFCKSAVVNFNAFKDVTGEYSFSTALLDGFNNGIILTSLYGHNSSNIYIRQIKNGECSTYLLDEEKEALERAVTGRFKGKE